MVERQTTNDVENGGVLSEEDTFYFILKEEDKTLILKEEMQKRICKKLEDVADVRFYGMRSDPDVRSSKALQEEFKNTRPEQVNIILIDREKDDQDEKGV